MSGLWASCLLLSVIPLSAIAVGRLIQRTRHLQDGPRDLLIAAAHQDDCVIAAGEYAIEAARAGRSIRLLWLTCGADSPDDPRAAQRTAEAIDAWSALGVPREHMHFLNLPESKITDRETRIDAAQAEAAQRSFEALVRELPESAAVLLPAKGEDHSDHRALREICVRGLRRVGRSDLLLLQYVEYNTYYSLLRGPVRALRYVFGSLPLVGALFARWLPASGSHPIDGGPALQLPPDAARLAQKRALLRRFASENPDLLVEYFGFPDIFQRLDLTDSALSTSPGHYVEFAGRRLGPTVVALWLWLLVATFTIALTAVTWLVDPAHGSWVIKLSVAGAGAALWLIARSRFHYQLERAVVYATAGAAMLTSIAL